MKQEEVDSKMSKALGVWAKHHNVRAVDFEDAMGWSYNHAFNVLRGKFTFTKEAYGTFIRAYGMGALLEVARIAGVNLDKTEDLCLTVSGSTVTFLTVTFCRLLRHAIVALTNQGANMQPETTIFVGDFCLYEGGVYG